MKKQIFTSLLGLSLLGATTSVVFSAEEQKEAQKFAVLDLDKIMRESSAAKQVQKDLEGRRKSFQSELQKYEGELRAEEQKLVALRDKKANEAEFNKKREAFEKRVTDVQKNVGQKRDQLEATFAEAMGQIQNEVFQLVSHTADTQHLTMVLPKSVVIFRSNEVDITDGILAELNAKLPKVEINKK